MKFPTRSLFALATSLLITLAFSGCASTVDARYAYMQDSDPGPSVRSAKTFSPQALAQSRRGRTHVQAAAKKLGVASVVSIGEGFFDVYVGDLMGHTRRLAQGYDIRNVQLSTDRTMIVFTALDTVSGFYQVYVGDSKLQTITQLTSDEVDHYDATISPDGETVAYDAYNNGTGYYALYTVPTAGGDPTMVPIELSLDLYYPAFTPNGAQLVFSGVDWEIGESALGIVDLDGGNLTQLTNDAADQYDLVPSVSADGSMITFSRAVFGIDIYTIPITGEPEGGATLLTDDGGSLESMYVNDQKNLETMPVDEHILFLSWRDGPLNIYKMDPDGANQERVTNNSLWQIFNYNID